MKIYDYNGQEKLNTLINEGGKRVYKLMTDDYLQIKFSLADPIILKTGDFVGLSRKQCDFVGKYELLQDYQPTYNVSTGGYDYDVRFDAEYFKWKNKKFCLTAYNGDSYSRRDKKWTLTDKVDGHIEQIIYNLKAMGFNSGGEDYTFEVDNHVANVVKTITYDSIDIISALNIICSKDNFDCEWWVVDNVIHIGRLEHTNEPLVYEIGVNAENITRQTSQGNYANRLYVYGSTKNLPSHYRLDEPYFNIISVNNLGSARIKERNFNVFKVAFDRDLESTYFTNYVKETFTHSCDNSNEDWQTHTSDESGFVSFGFSTKQLNIDGCYIAKPNLEWKIANGTFDGNYSLYAVDISNNRHKIASGDFGDISIPNALLDAATFNNGATIKYVLEFQMSGKCAVKLRGVILTEYNTPYIDTTIGLLSASEVKGGVNKTMAQKQKPMVYQSGNSNAIAAPHFRLNLKPGYVHTDSTTYPSVRGEEGYKVCYVLDEEGYTPLIGDKIRFQTGALSRERLPLSYFTDLTGEKTAIGVTEKRLQLPKGIIEGTNYYKVDDCIQSKKDLNINEIIEDVLILDDIYPRQAGWTMEVSDRTIQETTDFADGSTSVRDIKIYRFKNQQGVVFSQDFIKGGETLQVCFQSGKLAGLCFDLIFNPDGLSEFKTETDGSVVSNPDSQIYEIIRNENYGRMLPDDALYPATGDEYVLIGFDSEKIASLNLVNLAETELLTEGVKKLTERMLDGSTYIVSEMSDDVLKNLESLELHTTDNDKFVDVNDSDVNVYGDYILHKPGQRVQLINKSWFADKSQVMRILGFELSLDLRFDTPKYTIGQSDVKSRLKRIEEQLKRG